MDIIFDVKSQSLTVVRYAKATGSDFFAGVEHSHFIPAQPITPAIEATEDKPAKEAVWGPYYVFKGVVDSNNTPIKWFWASTANLLAEPTTLNKEDLFGSPVSNQFQLLTRTEFAAVLKTPASKPEFFERMKKDLATLGLSLE